MTIHKFWGAAWLLILSPAVQAQFLLQHDGSIPVVRDTVTLAMPWAGGMNWCQVSQADLDLDGEEDLFVFDRSGNEVIALIHQGGPGSSTYTYDPSISTTYPFNDLESWAYLRDYNCDGKQDLFSYSPGQGGFSVHKNVSTGNGLEFELAYSLVGSNYVPTWSPNLYVTQVDLPAIDDMDGDGDLDVLTFSIFGAYVEYHRNLSMEQYGTCDSLTYEVRNRCWGYFSEDPNNNSVDLFDSCGFNVPNPEFAIGIEKAVRELKEQYHRPIDGTERAAAHSGSTLLTMDLDDDGDKELTLGDISHENLTTLFNGGAVNDALITAQDSTYPNYDVPLQLPIFPGAFHVDVNLDGKRDLMVSPNATSLCQNFESMWYYLNTGTDEVPIFDWQRKDLFQRDMLEFGEGAYPVLFDQNGDGLQDVIVSNYGYFQAGGDYPGKMALLVNTGTATTPSFALVDTDWEGLSTSGIGAAMYPAFGDLDNDGDKDMIVGDLQGRMHFFRNIATGPVADFQLITPNITDDLGVTMDVGMFATPQLFLVDGDNLLDLLVGERNGNINYFRNTGTLSAPVWHLENDTIGELDVAEYWNVTGYSVPCMFLNGNNERELLVGSEAGWIHHFDDIDGNLNGSFNLVDSTFQDIKEGSRSSIAVADMNGDGFVDAFTGNYRGGLGFWRNDFGLGVGQGSLDHSGTLELRPNPAQEQVEILVNGDLVPGSRYHIVNALGQEVMTGTLPQGKALVGISGLGSGAYTVLVERMGIRLRARLLIAR
ncbi:MAG: T9SS type A sorting domain-containing protein [Flavobacteriales bacterium]|nr:T9SS type A sorting domain-containing protein [Flavobacteriales bacterium]MBP6698503.1 T9SS type A sorting domain-containing protein [Flavobacteriales bacterium]